jgi:MYXO-CTERM domain-containing protein
MRTLTFAACLLAVLPASGCLASPDGADELVDTEAQPIINGSPDSTHQAVVAVLGNQSECSGTIIHVASSTGYVLTAAHCCTAQNPPVVVRQGNSYVSGYTQYNVTGYKAHPGYNGQIDDFCVVKFGGASAATPVIPAMSPAQDSLHAGSVVDFVGYGITGFYNNDPNQPKQNSQRLHVSGTLTKVDTYTLQYSQASSGPCEGDSGGPSLSSVNGQEVVSGVTSYGDQLCKQYGVSGRVSAVYDSFIMAYINGQPIAQTCNDCYAGATSGQGACVGSVDACLNDANCNGLVTCLNDCAQNDQACVDACASQWQAGISKYNAINSCVCTTGCPSECGGDPACQGANAKCGLSTSVAACESCLESSCCAEAQACADDGVCPTCFSNSPDPSCNQNAPADAFYTCLSNACAQPCGLGQGGTTTSTGSGGTGATSTAATGAGGGGATGTGVGGSTDTTTGSGGSKKHKSSSSDTTEVGGCAVASSPGGERSGTPLALAAAALGVIVVRRRRRV